MRTQRKQLVNLIGRRGARVQEGRRHTVKSIADMNHEVAIMNPNDMHTPVPVSADVPENVEASVDFSEIDIAPDLAEPAHAVTPAGVLPMEPAPIEGHLRKAALRVPEAIEDARLNSEANGITNTRFYAGDMKDVLNDDFIARNGHPDVMILDPPRAGVDPRVIEVILRAAPERIVYVSCNPATQARDLSLLDAAYRVTAVQPVDMFPHTHHVENVVRLDRR